MQRAACRQGCWLYPPAAQACGSSLVTIPASGAPPQQVPGPHFQQECHDQAFLLQPRLVFLPFPSRQHSFALRHPHVYTQNSSCCSSRAKAQSTVPQKATHPPWSLSTAWGGSAFPPEPWDNVPPPPTWTLSFREGCTREVAAEPIQHFTSLIPLERQRQILAVPAIRYQSLSVCQCQHILIVRLRIKVSPAGPRNILFGSG